MMDTLNKTQPSKTDKLCMGPVFSKSFSPPDVENWPPWSLKISTYFQFTVHFRVFLSPAFSLAVHCELHFPFPVNGEAFMNLPRCPFNIPLSFSEPHLASWRCCGVFKKSPKSLNHMTQIHKCSNKCRSGLFKFIYSSFVLLAKRTALGGIQRRREVL